MQRKRERQLEKRKRRAQKRIDKANWSGQSPMIDPPAIQYELAERTQAIAAGGLGVVQQFVRQRGVAESVNRGCPLFKFHLPYSEADHVLNVAYNLLAGGTCLEHLELRRSDEAYLDALGAQRIPDPTTAGDFCRRFSAWDVFALMEAFHEPRLKVWQQQPDEFFERAVIEADGSMVETCGERKEGIGMNYNMAASHRRVGLPPAGDDAGQHARGAVPAEPSGQLALARERGSLLRPFDRSVPSRRLPQGRTASHQIVKDRMSTGPDSNRRHRVTTAVSCRWTTSACCQ